MSLYIIKAALYARMTFRVAEAIPNSSKNEDLFKANNFQRTFFKSQTSEGMLGVTQK